MEKEKKAIQPVKTSLHAFNRAKVKSLEMIALLICAADQVIKVNFLVVDTPSVINVIIRRALIHAVKGIVSTLH